MWRLGIAILWLLERFRLFDRNRVKLLPEKVRQLIEDATEVEVFSLAGPNEGSNAFMNADILGSIAVDDVRTRRRLLRQILLANRYNLGGMQCLGAEYGVKLRSDELTVELTFCFHCSMVWANGSNELSASGTISPFLVLPMSRLLKRAGIPLPPPHED